MGRNGSSSKRKSSKKKKSKISSETRRRKTSKRNKSKKLHRLDDSTSYSDESTRSLSISFSDSEDDYKSRKALSHVRNDAMSNRKRARSSSSCRESSVDSPRVRKRKRSKKIGDSKLRKKIQKKKSRRDASVSSSHIDSRICSTFRHGSTSSRRGSEFERMRGRSRENNKDERSSGKARSGTKKSKNRSRSSSSCSRYSDSIDDHSKEKVAGEINSRRLRSVITVTKPLQEREENERDKYEHTEEIVYDQDDYPSYRSNDSNDGGKRDLAHHSHVASEKRRVENMMGKEGFVSKLESQESKLSGEDRSDRYDGYDPHSDEARTTNPEKENETDVSATATGSGNDNLESILRQKALENLLRFRGGPQPNAGCHETKIENNVKLSTAKADIVQNKSPEREVSSVVGATQLVEQNSIPTLRRDSSCPMWTEEKNLGGRDSGIESRAAKQGVVSLSNGEAISGNPKGKDYTTAYAVINKSESTTSALKQESSGTASTLKQLPSHASPQATLPVTKNIINKSAAETSKTVPESSSNKHSAGVIDACAAALEPSSCVKPTSEEHSSRERQDEAKANSQFEKKTMSVMRGGEMVQVNYKVYIPNKAPALARRLQR